MFDDTAGDIPGSWLPALARIAGSGDIAELLAAMAALFVVAVPYDTLVLTCQLTAEVFERGVATRDPLLSASVHSITAQSLSATIIDQTTEIDVRHMPMPEPFAARGWSTALAMSIPYRGLFCATAILYRDESQGPFGADARRTASMVKLICSRALDRLLDQQQAQALNKMVLGFLNDLPVGLIMLDWDWSIVSVNQEGYRQALRWNHAPNAPPRNAHARLDFQIPTEVYTACNEIRNRLYTLRNDAVSDPAASDGEPNEALRTLIVQHPARADMRMSVTASRSLDTPHEPPKFLIRFYGMTTRTEADFEPTAEQLKLLAQLTTTERTIALLVRQGLSNREISERLHREVSTVKDHLTHIFDKLAIRSRVNLARMLS